MPKGTYKVRLASHGLDPTDPLTVATLTVTLDEGTLAPGDTVKVTVELDPAKASEYEAGAMERTATAEV